MRLSLSFSYSSVVNFLVLNSSLTLVLKSYSKSNCSLVFFIALFRRELSRAVFPSK
ncbi:hypothetical protein Barb7_02467 [Bacteroidales bacterium Barb7]|nr:hypothetical protein Barb7_02467 [Bacteroidales bacterium Barb7]